MRITAQRFRQLATLLPLMVPFAAIVLGHRRRGAISKEPSPFPFSQAGCLDGLTEARRPTRAAEPHGQPEKGRVGPHG